MFQTPPSTVRKESKRFMEASNPLPYYEDFHGDVNEDEAFDRFPDQCEEETDSEDEDRNRTSKRPVQSESIARSSGFFKRFTNPMRSNPMPGTQSDRRGEVTSKSAPSIYDNPNLPFTPPSQKPTFNSPDTSSGLKSVPSPKLRSPFATPNTSKKLKSVKFGMFSPSAGRAMASYFVENEAGEVMDDILATRSLGEGYEGGFETVENVDAENDSEPERGSKLAPGKEKSGYGYKPTAAQEGEEADVEDNAVTVRKGATAVEDSSPVVDRKTERKKRSRVKTSGPVRTSSRLTSQQVGLSLNSDTKLTRPTFENGFNEKAARVKEGNRQKMVSRAAAIRNKAVSKDEPATSGTRNKKRVMRGTRGGLRWKNWKGELIADAKAIVVVEDDEVADPGEFQRYFA